MVAKYCEPCTARGITTTASQWCTECEEALCPDCTEAHRVLKMSRNHHLVEIGKIPETINLSYNCLKHQQLPFDYFCVDHDVICCKECWPKNHKTCQNVTSIDIASKNSKQSQSFLDSEEQLRFILEALEKLNHNCKDNKSKIKKEETQILKQIKIMKENVLKQLEALEGSLLKQLTEKKDKYITSLKRQEECIMDLTKSTKDQKESLEFIRDHGSEKQAFVYIHLSQPALDEIENKVKQITESVADTSLLFVESISEWKIADLGSIELTETPCYFPFVPYKQQQSQIPIVLKRKITSLTPIYDIDMRGEKLIGVTGMTISDNNTLIFCDLITRKVCFCDKHDVYQSSISFSFSPWDIAAIPGTTTAVMSSHENYFIQFIDISNRRLLNTIEVKQSEKRGIAATKDHIIIAQKGKIQVLDVRGKFKRNIRLEGTDYNPLYISVCSNGNICIPVEDEIRCITYDGTSVFTYASPDLRGTRSIQMADDGHIYVVGRYSQNIHKLTTTGTLVDILLIANVSEPLAFCFSQDFSKIYIANKKGKAISVFKTDK